MLRINIVPVGKGRKHAFLDITRTRRQKSEKFDVCLDIIYENFSV
jgi:hypothetical protein